MKQYFLLFFAVLLLGSCNKNLQIATTKPTIYTAKKQNIPVLALQTKTVVSNVILQPLASSKMALSSQNIYEQAFYQIRQMLQGGKPLSFKKSIYLTENAYFDDELPENSFNQAITDLVILAKAVEKTSKFSYKYADSVNLRKNYAIYRVLADTLNIANVFQLLPYEYDFEDSRGEKEWAKGFVTKLLATRTGNCHSLPFLYKILAEELGTEAYLSLLPHHIYLQIPYQRPPYGSVSYFNTELTSKTFPLDAWVMAMGYVSLPAIQTGMYMDRLDNKQSIALCLVDLAKGFEARNKDKLSTEEIDKFMQNCVNLALQTAPDLITARLLQVELDKRNFVSTHNKVIHKQLETNITKLFADGYLELPELMYSEQPRTAGLDSTYTPFYEENQREGNPAGYGKKVLTLSNGRYDEFLTTKKIETVGGVRFDTERKKIVGFGENKREVEVVSRFLSVDPLAQSYPFYTPYQFAGNTPIRAIDLDGKEPWSVVEYNTEDGEYKFTQPAIALLSAVSGVEPALIARTQVEVGYVKILGYYLTGGGAMTTNEQIDLTRHYFASNSNDNVHDWLSMNSHEVTHLWQRQMFNNGAAYIGAMLDGYVENLGHDNAPREIVAESGRKDYSNFLFYIGGHTRLAPSTKPMTSFNNGKAKIEGIFTNLGLSEKDKVDQIINLYQGYITTKINEYLSDLQNLNINDPNYDKKTKEINNSIRSLQDKDVEVEKLKSYNNPNGY